MKGKQKDPRDSIFYREQRRLGRSLYLHEKIKVILFWVLVIALVWIAPVTWSQMLHHNVNKEPVLLRHADVYGYIPPRAGRNLPVVQFIGSDGGLLFVAPCGSMANDICRGLISTNKKLPTPIKSVVAWETVSKSANIPPYGQARAIIEEISILGGSDKILTYNNKSVGSDLYGEIISPYHKYRYFLRCFVLILSLYIVLQVYQAFINKGERNE